MLFVSSCSSIYAILLSSSLPCVLLSRLMRIPFSRAWICLLRLFLSVVLSIFWDLLCIINVSKLFFFQCFTQKYFCLIDEQYRRSLFLLLAASILPLELATLKFDLVAPHSAHFERRLLFIIRQEAILRNLLPALAKFGTSSAIIINAFSFNEPQTNINCLLSPSLRHLAYISNSIQFYFFAIVSISIMFFVILAVCCSLNSYLFFYDTRRVLSLRIQFPILPMPTIVTMVFYLTALYSSLCRSSIHLFILLLITMLTCNGVVAYIFSTSLFKLYSSILITFLKPTLRFQVTQHSTELDSSQCLHTDLHQLFLSPGFIIVLSEFISLLHLFYSIVKQFFLRLSNFIYITLSVFCTYQFADMHFKVIFSSFTFCLHFYLIIVSFLPKISFSLTFMQVMSISQLALF